MSSLKLVSWVKFFFLLFFPSSEHIVRNRTKSMECCRVRLLYNLAHTNHGCRPRLSVLQQVIPFQSQELYPEIPPRPSIQHHYHSPMVNNYKSKEIHKPLRWYLLSLTLGSSDIHSLEVRASKPIIFSIYAIFPSIYHMNYAFCHNLPAHFSSQES